MSDTEMNTYTSPGRNTFLTQDPATYFKPYSSSQYRAAPGSTYIINNVPTLNTLKRFFPVFRTLNFIPYRLTSPIVTQRRHLSSTTSSLARVIHPDTDTFVKYSLLHGQPRNSKANIYKALAIYPLTMEKAAVEYRMLDELVRHIDSQSDSHSLHRIERHANGTSTPPDDTAAKVTNHGPRANIDAAAESLVSKKVDAAPRPVRGSGSGGRETPELVRRTVARYCALFSAVSASAVVGYSVRCWETDMKQGEGEDQRRRQKGGMAQ